LDRSFISFVMYLLSFYR